MAWAFSRQRRLPDEIARKAAEGHGSHKVIINHVAIVVGPESGLPGMAKAANKTG